MRFLESSGTRAVEIVKLNPASLRKMVTNYDELAEAVARSEFAEMLATGSLRHDPGPVLLIGLDAAD